MCYHQLEVCDVEGVWRGQVRGGKRLVVMSNVSKYVCTLGSCIVIYDTYSILASSIYCPYTRGMQIRNMCI